MAKDRVAVARPAQPAIRRPVVAPAANMAQDKAKFSTAGTANGTPEPELFSAPEKAPGWLRWAWDMTFGNTENKLFQIKFNLIHFKDVLLNLFLVLQTGPLSPIFNLLESFAGLISGAMTRFKGAAATVAAEGGVFGKLVTYLGKAARPLQKAAGVTLRFLERTAPIFGWLTVVQDLYKAVVYQKDEKSSTGRKVLGWFTFALGTIGATATTLAGMAATGAAVTAFTGVGPATLGTIAIVCFGISLLTGWLAGNMDQEPKKA